MLIQLLDLWNRQKSWVFPREDSFKIIQINDTVMKLENSPNESIINICVIVEMFGFAKETWFGKKSLKCFGQIQVGYFVSFIVIQKFNFVENSLLVCHMPCLES